MRSANGTRALREHRSAGSARSSRWRAWLAPLFAIAFTAGCGDKANPTVTTSASAEPAPEAIAKVPLDSIVPPAEVVAYGGVENVDKLLEPLAGLRDVIGPGMANVKAQIPTMVEKTFAIKASALDLAKPVRFAVFDPKKFSKGFIAFLFHAANRAAVVAALPEGKLENDAQNEFGWDTPGGRAYLNMAGDVAVITVDPGVFQAESAFLKQLSASEVKPTAPGADPGVTLLVPMPHVFAIFAGQIDQAFAAMKAQGSAPGIDPKSAHALESMVKVDEAIRDVGKEIDTLTLNLRPTSEGYALAFEVKPLAGSDLDGFAKSVKSEGSVALLDRFPKASPAFVTASLGAGDNPMVGKAMRLFATMSMSQEQADRVMAAWGDYMKASTGEMVFGAFPKKDGSFGVVAMWGVKDAEGARAAQKKMLDAYEDKAMKDALEAQGLVVHVDPKAYSIAGIDVAVQKTEMKNAPPGVAALASFLEVHTAVGTDTAYVAYGPTAKESLTLMIDPKAEGRPEIGLSRSPAYDHASKSGVDKPLMVAFAAADSLFAGGNTDTTTKPGISLTAGVKNGRFQLSIDAPSAAVGPAIRGISAAVAQLQAPTGAGAGAVPAPSASAAPRVAPPTKPVPRNP